jgi:hypothetical protein
MSAPESILPEPPPAGEMLSWVTKRPAEVAAYLETVRAIRRLEIVVTQSGVTKRFPVIISGENAIVSVAL